MLAYPDLHYPFVIHSDVSEKGLEKVLYQHQEGKLRLIGYSFRILTGTKRNYEQHLKEE